MYRKEVQMGSEVKKMRHDNLVQNCLPPPPPVARLQMAVKTKHPFLQGQAHQILDYVFKPTVEN
jgi:hypothetical protein